MANTGEQNEPIMEGEDGSQRAKADGILAQSEQDFTGHPLEDVLDLLRQRFEQAGVQIDQATLEREARRISGS
jgi:hypothetical protein